MTDFVAIDFETANTNLTSICAVGCVKVENGVITDRFYSLVQPEPNYFIRRFTDIHGITDKDVEGAPTFDALWPKLKEFIGELPLVAHNAPFDGGCLRSTLKHYGISRPDNPFFCTLDKARRTIPRTLCASFALPSLASFLGIPFKDHHYALSDAEICAKIAQTLL